MKLTIPFVFALAGLAIAAPNPAMTGTNTKTKTTTVDPTTTMKTHTKKGPTGTALPTCPKPHMIAHCNKKEAALDCPCFYDVKTHGTTSTATGTCAPFHMTYTCAPLPTVN